MTAPRLAEPQSLAPPPTRPLRILVLVGTRPEVIKLAPVVRELERHREHFEVRLCATGQHRELLHQALSLFGLVPELDLELMEPDQTLARLTSRVIEGVDRLVDDVRPDWLLAQGDTTTVLGGALAAFYRGVRFGHVEAGLRTGDLRQPFPEEMNRRLVDGLADALFAPTPRAVTALEQEGIDPNRVYLTGNTVVDALSEIAAREYDWSVGSLAAIPAGKRLVLVTAHRRESFGVPLEQVCGAVRRLALQFADNGIHFVFPIHPNPRVRDPVARTLVGLENVSLLEPLDYLAQIQLMKEASLILTDSGGIQEEAPSFGVPVLVLRDKTERPEAVEVGIARVVGTDADQLVAEVERVLLDTSGRNAMVNGGNPFGDGRAAARIAAILSRYQGAS